MTKPAQTTPPPIFLERTSYRRRRLWDAVRMLPFLGAALWMVPLMWPAADSGQGVSTSSALLYLFAVWVFVALVARLLWRGTTQAAPPSD